MKSRLWPTNSNAPSRDGIWIISVKSAKWYCCHGNHKLRKPTLKMWFGSSGMKVWDFFIYSVKAGSQSFLRGALGVNEGMSLEPTCHFVGKVDFKPWDLPISWMTRPSMPQTLFRLKERSNRIESQKYLYKLLEEATWQKWQRRWRRQLEKSLLLSRLTFRMWKASMAVSTLILKVRTLELH